MLEHLPVEDPVTRKAIQNLDSRLERIEKIPQLSSDTTIEQLIAVVNKITDSIKRRNDLI